MDHENATQQMLADPNRSAPGALIHETAPLRDATWKWQQIETTDQTQFISDWQHFDIRQMRLRSSNLPAVDNITDNRLRRVGENSPRIYGRKSYMSFRLVPNWVTLNDPERRNGPYFALFYRIW